ncbi:MAG: WD40 repeat domain-containing protein [Pseudomonadota bacterium]
MQSDTLNQKHLLLDAPATGCGFVGKHFACADGEGFVHLIGSDGADAKKRLHEGAILSFATDEKTATAYSGGDDGAVMKMASGADPVPLHKSSKWVDIVVSSPHGHVAWAAGKSIFLLKKGQEEAAIVSAPSSVGGLAFSPDGKWLGAAVYGGALLILLANPDKTQMLDWQGSHGTIGFSPDGRFCVTSMLENALHVWRIDKPGEKHGRMGAYPAKPLSFSWTADGRYLATSGADVLVLWPFIQADGPIGQSAGVVSLEQQSLVRAVACRPRSQHVAIGHIDGSVTLYDRKAQQHHVLAPASSMGPVIELKFSADGRSLGFIREGGEAGLFDLGAP